MSDDIEDAPAPFSGVPDLDNHNCPPDFILRSCDGIDFHVHKDILKFASDFFNGMFAMPVGDGDPSAMRRDGKPVLVLPEPEEVLLSLLLLAYPARSLGHYTIERLGIFVAVHEAACKYQFTSVQLVLKEMVNNLDSCLIDAQPYRAFAIARLYDLPHLARKAALSALKEPLTDGVPAFPEMKHLTWEDAHTLSRFHRQCGRNAVEIAENSLNDDSNVYHGRRLSIWNNDTHKVYVWWQYGHSVKPGEKFYSGRVRLAAVQWFKDHIARLAAQLRLRPLPATAEMEARNVVPAARPILDACFVCSNAADADLASFGRQLATEIDLSNKRLGKLSHSQCPHPLTNLLHLPKPMITF
jgi:hypothetical protein